MINFFKTNFVHQTIYSKIMRRTFLLLFILTSCQSGVEVIDPPGSNPNNPEVSILPLEPNTLELVSNNEASWDLSTPLINVREVRPGDQVALFKDSQCSQLIGSAVAINDSVEIRTDKLNYGRYEIFANASNEAGKSACSKKSLSYTYPQIPLAPSAFQIISPASPVGTNPNPVFLASGIRTGETIRIYTDKGCREEVALGVATGSSLQLTSKDLAKGNYNFYYQVTNAFMSSSCLGPFASYSYGLPPASPSSISRINPVNSSGTVSTPTFEIKGVNKGDIVKLYSNSSCNWEIGSARSSATSVSITTVELIPGFYNFYATSANDFGTSPCSSVFLVYQLGRPPIAPSSIQRINPTSPSGTEMNPIIRIGGVLLGDRIKIFSDPLCSVEVGSGISTGTIIDIRTTALAQGRYQFFSNSSNAFGTSECSRTSADYIVTGAYPSVTVTDLNSGVRNLFISCGIDQITIQEKITHCGFLNKGATVVVDSNLGKIWKLVTKTKNYELWKDMKSGLVWSGDLGVSNWCLASGNKNDDLNSQCWRLQSQNAWSFCREEMALKYSDLTESGITPFLTSTWARIEAPGLSEHWSSGTYHEGKGYMGLNPTSMSPTVSWRLPSKSDFEEAMVNGFKEVIYGGKDFQLWSSTIYSRNIYSHRWYASGSAGLWYGDLGNSKNIRCIFNSP